MIRSLIIADDFTGALDSGAGFAAHGVRTLVVVGTEVPLDTDTEVLVVDAETRHMPAADAYDTVFHLVTRAKKAGISCIYKKTDSALRGNIGAELTALLRASGADRLPFLPAFPQMGRTTENGVHLIKGVPVAESVFGKDPFEPVDCSVVAGLIAKQSDIPVKNLSPLTEKSPLPEDQGILIFDARTLEDLEHTGRRLAEDGALQIAAGCAGFAAVLPELLGLGQGGAVETPPLDPRLLVVCGSVNPITIGQVAYASGQGFHHMLLTPEQKLSPGYWDSPQGAETLETLRTGLREHPLCIIDTNDPQGSSETARYARELGLNIDGIRVGVSRSIGRIVGELFSDPSLGTLLITGGDTLLQCMRQMGVDQMEPVCEMEAGVILSRFTYQGCTRYVISKSGGFGKSDLLTELAEKISGRS